MIITTPQWRYWAERADRYATPTSRERVLADVAMGEHYQESGHFAAYAARASRALDVARRLERPELCFRVAGLILGATCPPRYEVERLRIAQEVAAWPQHGVSAGLLAPTLNAAWPTLLDWGRRAEAETMREQVAELARRCEEPGVVRAALTAEVLTLARAGHLEAAVAKAEEVVAWFEGRWDDYGTRRWDPNLRASRAMLWLGRGEELLAARMERAGQGHLRETAHVALYLAHLGRIDEARERLGVLLARILTAPDEDDVPGFLLLCLLECAWLVGDAGAAAVLSPRLECVAGLGGIRSSANLVALHLGAAAALLRRRDESLGYFRQALEVAERAGSRPEASLARLQLAEVLLHRAPAVSVTFPATAAYPCTGDPTPGEVAEAGALLDLALRDMEEMGMRPALEQARLVKDSLGC